MRVALYARVSRADKDQDTENQLIKLREYAKTRGWKIYAEYSDHVSGAAPIKPGLEEAQREGRARHYDALIVVRLDRLARSVRQLLSMAEEFDRFGVALICTDQEIDTKSPMGRLFFTILGAVAEFELELIRERTLDGLSRAKAQGKRLGRPPKPARTQEILQLRAQGLSYRQIGLKLGMSHQAIKQRLRRARVQKGDEAE